MAKTATATKPSEAEQKRQSALDNAKAFTEKGRARLQCVNPSCGLFFHVRRDFCPACGAPKPETDKTDKPDKSKSKRQPSLPTGDLYRAVLGAVPFITRFGSASAFLAVVKALDSQGLADLQSYIAKAGGIERVRSILQTLADEEGKDSEETK